jgi:hypothetical protein
MAQKQILKQKNEIKKQHKKMNKRTMKQNT